MKLVKFKAIQACLFVIILSLTGCATQLAPRYDAALFDDLTKANVKIMELFASVSIGTKKDSCDTRQAKFNEVIGWVDALALQSKARPIPNNDVTEKINAYLASRGISTGTDDTPPSATALEQVSNQITKMKELDCKQGLAPLAVAAFKNAVIISMDQAITYESFLNR